MVYGYHKVRKSDITNGDRITVYFDGKQEKRYIREIVFGKRRPIQYWQVTTDPETLPQNSTWYLMTKIPGVKYKDIGNMGRNWVVRTQTK